MDNYIPYLTTGEFESMALHQGLTDDDICDLRSFPSSEDPDAASRDLAPNVPSNDIRLNEQSM
jgi:hypothetical protein